METSSSNDDHQLPEVGDVVAFEYLWKDESDQGRVEGIKTRPCVVVSVGSGPRIVLMPITSQDPGELPAVRLSGNVLVNIGLTRPSWIMISEVNVSDWPGFDFRHAHPPVGGWWRYGRLADKLLEQVIDSFQTAISSKNLRVVKR